MTDTARTCRPSRVTSRRVRKRVRDGSAAGDPGAADANADDHEARIAAHAARVAADLDRLGAGIGGRAEPDFRRPARHQAYLRQVADVAGRAVASWRDGDGSWWWRCTAWPVGSSRPSRGPFAGREEALADAAAELGRH